MATVGSHHRIIQMSDVKKIDTHALFLKGFHIGARRGTTPSFSGEVAAHQREPFSEPGNRRPSWRQVSIAAVPGSPPE